MDFVWWDTNWWDTNHHTVASYEAVDLRRDYSLRHLGGCTLGMMMGLVVYDHGSLKQIGKENTEVP